MPKVAPDKRMVVARKIIMNATQEDVDALQLIQDKYHIQSLSDVLRFIIHEKANIIQQNNSLNNKYNSWIGKKVINLDDDISIPKGTIGIILSFGNELQEPTFDIDWDVSNYDFTMRQLFDLDDDSKVLNLVRYKSVQHVSILLE